MTGFDTLHDAVVQRIATLEARTSTKYVATMSKILLELNQAPPNILQNIDTTEVAAQSGHLVYFTIKNIPNEIPLDLSYATELCVHLRRPLTLLLKKHCHQMTSAHRRVLSRLMQMHELERLSHPGKLDLDLKYKSCMGEMARLHQMSKMIKGARRLDILMEALRKPALFKVEVHMFLSILGDRRHPTHDLLMDWLRDSSYNGDGMAIKINLQRKLKRIDVLSQEIIKEVEYLSGFVIHQNQTDILHEQTWYTLGEALPHGQAFIQSFINNKQTTRKIKRHTFLIIRINHNAGYMSSKINKVLRSEIQDAERLSTLCALFFELSELIEASTGTMSLAYASIELDLKSGMLTNKEYAEAKEWVRINRIRLQELLLDLFQSIEDMATKNPSLLVPRAIKQIFPSLQETFNSEMEQVRSEFDATNLFEIADWQLEWEQLQGYKEQPNDYVTKLIVFLHKIQSQKSQIDFRNVDFLKQIRMVQPSFNAYEEKMFEIMNFEDELDQLYRLCEQHILDTYRQVRFKDLANRDIEECLKSATRRCYREIRALNYAHISASGFEAWLNDAKKQVPAEAIIQIYQILQEIHAVPDINLLSQALQDWEKDLSEEEVREKAAFLRGNSNRLKECVQVCRKELRELLKDHVTLIPRIYFEVFGLSDYNAVTLGLAATMVQEQILQINTPHDVEFLSNSLCALEAQVFMSQKITQQNGSAEYKILSLYKKGLINKDLFRRIITDLRNNFTRLGKLLVTVSALQDELQRMRVHLGTHKGKEHLNLILDTKDIKELRGTYHFLKDTSIPDIKKFCMAYNTYNLYLKEAIACLSKRDSILFQDLKNLLTRDMLKFINRNHSLPDQIRIPVLLLEPQLLEALCSLLNYHLNFVNPGDLSEKRVYTGILNLLSRMRAAKQKETRQIKRLWGKIQISLFAFNPVHHKSIYKGNRDQFVNCAKQALEPRTGSYNSH